MALTLQELDSKIAESVQKSQDAFLDKLTVILDKKLDDQQKSTAEQMKERAKAPPVRSFKKVSHEKQHSFNEGIRFCILRLSPDLTKVSKTSLTDKS